MSETTENERLVHFENVKKKKFLFFWLADISGPLPETMERNFDRTKNIYIYKKTLFTLRASPIISRGQR